MTDTKDWVSRVQPMLHPKTSPLQDVRPLCGEMETQPLSGCITVRRKERVCCLTSFFNFLSKAFKCTYFKLMCVCVIGMSS